MVPRVAKRGRSFKGAGFYYLHDKKARSRERVLFTMTVNLPTDDPDKALGWMAYTAMRQEDIKRAAGTTSRGRKLASSVYSYSLSWAPDEAPTKEQMIEAAFSSMERLGIRQHEAVLIAHTDTPHPHIHVIANRVHPETGLAAPLSKDHIVLSEWAEAYERVQGQIRIDRRVENNKERRRGRFMKDKDSDDTAAYRRWQKARERTADEQRRRQQQDLSDAQKREQAELERKARDELDTVRKTQKEVQRADWSDFYKRQKKERDAFEKAQQTPVGRLRYWLTNREIDRWHDEDSTTRQGMLSRAYQILSDGNIMRDQVIAKEVRERKELAARLNALTEAKIAPIQQRHELARKKLADRQLAARQQQSRDQKQERDDRARLAREGKDRSAFEFDQAAKDTARTPQPERGRSDDFNRFGNRATTRDGAAAPADDTPAPEADTSPAPPDPAEEFNVFGRRDKSREAERDTTDQGPKAGDSDSIFNKGPTRDE